ncbi:hypothetical protein HER10_EVM0007538 [Colletotrichum scovillei]|uniref:uncharacterized protein n=1 Tax=Colletotrichum scovillei TaxID=1209932 RepID=UPI0015C34E45|nr:uncharacterized protein HER10_EVM0007538 [Colletotrichum scovillei]KAF4783222.1 hypothetical protein HER10_EVM0007538 [Colletotrichum scovillei]
MASDSMPPDFYVKALQFTKKVYRDEYPAIKPENSELSLAGKVVVITGASRGIGGRGIVPAFARAGAKAIVLVARDEKKLTAVAAEVKELNANVETLVYPVDMTDEAGIKALFEKVNATYGHADVLVNNAAVQTSLELITNSDPKLWIDDLVCRKPEYSLLSPDDTGETSSLTREKNTRPPTSYIIAKLATQQLNAHVAAEHPDNVTTVSVHPGMVHTDMTMDRFRPFAHDTPALVGGTAVWLCSEKAQFMNGRFVATNWDVEELVERKGEIEEKRLLQVDLNGQFGAQQFE